MKGKIALLLIFTMLIGFMPINTITANADGGLNLTGMIEEQGTNLKDSIKSLLEKGSEYFKELASKFKDMGNHWADNTVGKLVELGILDGYSDGTFKPNNTITRSEFSKVVRTSLQLELIEGNAFEDTTNHWAKNEINTLVENEILLKEEYGSHYEPTKNITRLEMAKMIVRALNLDEQAKDKAGEKTKFIDDVSINSEDKGYIIIASENKIINGYPNRTFKPYGEATRAEACQMIVNMFDAIDKGIDLGEEETPTEPTQPPKEQEEKLSKNARNSKYINTNALKVNSDGEVVIDGVNLKGDVFPNIDETVINLANSLVDDVNNTDYVNTWYKDYSDEGQVTLMLAENELQAQFGRYSWRYTIYEKSSKNMSRYNENFSDNVQMTISIDKIWNSSEFDTENKEWVNPYYKEKFINSLESMFGVDGKAMGEYMIAKYEEKRIKGRNALVGVQETKKFGDIQVDYYNDDMFADLEVLFYITID